MEITEPFLDAFERIQDGTQSVLAGITDDALYYLADPKANTIAWLAWHIARGQDAQIADLAGTEQVWVTERWAERLGLPLGSDANGYGDSPEQVAAVRCEPTQLAGYLGAVTSASGDYVSSLGAADLDRVVDDSWDPPVTVGVRLMSIIADDLEHLGQAAFVRGVAERR